MGSLKSLVRWTFLAMMFLLADESAATAGGDGVQEGLTWLRGTQRTDDLWGFDDRLVVRDSVEVLRAFESLAKTDAALLALREALVAQAPATVDLDARLVEALRPSISETILAISLAELAATRSKEGGWGIDR